MRNLDEPKEGRNRPEDSSALASPITSPRLYWLGGLDEM